MAYFQSEPTNSSFNYSEFDISHSNGTHQPDVYHQRFISPFVFKVSVSVTLSLIILVAIIGNSFVIAAFCLRRRLRKASNYFILNLAITDFSLSVVILPVSALYDVLGTWLFGPELCLIWTVFDVFVSTASILNLVAISADRYMAIR